MNLAVTILNHKKSTGPPNIVTGQSSKIITFLYIYLDRPGSENEPHLELKFFENLNDTRSEMTSFVRFSRNIAEILYFYNMFCMSSKLSLWFFYNLLPISEIDWYISNIFRKAALRNWLNDTQFISSVSKFHSDLKISYQSNFVQKHCFSRMVSASQKQ